VAVVMAVVLEMTDKREPQIAAVVEAVAQTIEMARQAVLVWLLFVIRTHTRLQHLRLALQP
jgi:hypothetical protein